MTKSQEMGIIYVSSLSNHTPQTLRSLISKYTTVNRIYLAPYDTKTNNSKRVRYKEGWVECLNAPTIATLLNTTTLDKTNIKIKSKLSINTPITAKYLNNFKWINLNELLAYEKKQRDKLLDIEREHSRKEMGIYMRNVNKSKMISAIEKKRGDKVSSSSGEVVAVKKNIRQRKVIQPITTVSRVINKLF